MRGGDIVIVDIDKVQVYRYNENIKPDAYYGSALVLKENTDLDIRVIDKVMGAKVKSSLGKAVNLKVNLLQKKDGSAFINLIEISLDGNK